MQKLSDELATVARDARQATSMANFNLQYSQKCNIKILVWQEQRKKNLKENFCMILKQRVNMDVNPADILEMHRVPGSRSDGTHLVEISKLSIVNL